MNIELLTGQFGILLKLQIKGPNMLVFYGPIDYNEAHDSCDSDSTADTNITTQTNLYQRRSTKRHWLSFKKRINI